MHKCLVFFLFISGASVFEMANAQTSAIQAPGNLVATTLTTTTIRLTWSDNSSNETGFYVERSLASEGGFAVIATLGANITSYYNTGVTENITYFYRIRAFNPSIGNSYYSSVASANTITPIAPAGLTATAVSTTEINLTWTDNSTSEVGFVIERSSAPGGTYTTIATTVSNVTTYSDVGLNANAPYFYRLYAANGGIYSNRISASTTTMPTTASPPSAPTGLIVTASSTTQINLTWADNSTTETGFQIERSLISGSSFSLIATTAANVTSYSNTGLTAGTQYYYRVRATNGGGNSSFSSGAGTTTLGLPNPPSAPTSLAAAAPSATQINLSWTDNSTNETGFQIERSLSLGSGFAWVTTTAADVTSYLNTGLTANTKYYYRVRATNAGGNSAYTSEASAMTLALQPPAAPGVPHLQGAASFSVVVSWRDNSNDETYFRIWWQEANGGSWFPAGVTQPNVYSFICEGLTPRTGYIFRVSAGNSAGESFSPVSNTIVTPQFIPNYNWIKETVVLEKDVLSDTQVEDLVIEEGQKSLTWNYFDGLGRPMQTVNVASSPSGGDIIQPIVYDNFGRETTKFLPYVSNESNGWYRASPVGTTNYSSSPQAKFYQSGGLIAKDDRPYAEIILEPSPLNRVLEQGAPGASWQPDGTDSYTSIDHTVKKAYEANQANEVLLLRYTGPTDSNPLGLNKSMPAYYAANELFKNKTKDEQHNEVIEYTDKEGRVVLKKVQAPDNKWADTYYVYDDFGNLVIVLPPEAVKALTTN